MRENAPGTTPRQTSSRRAADARGRDAGRWMPAERSAVSIDRHTLSLRYRARESTRRPDSSSRIIDTLSLEELFDLITLEEDIRARLRDPTKLFWFANGFQSWSPGWELYGLARNPNLRIVKILERYTHRDRQHIGRAELAAHGFAYLRSGECFLALFSRNRGGPPVTLRIDRRRMRIDVELHSDGASFERHQELAELLLFYREGYFTFRDSVAELCSGLTAMRRVESFVGTLSGSSAGPSIMGAGAGRARDDLRIGGWCSWYSHYTKIDEATTRADLAGIVTSPNLVRELFIARGEPAVFQVDDGWQRAIGDWEPHPRRFPGGMRRQAEAIREAGLIPGLWVAPFAVAPSARVFRETPEWLLRDEEGRLVRAGYNPNWEGIFYCLDLSLPEVRASLSKLFATIVEDWGFRYLKLDFLYAGMLNGRHAAPGGAYRWYREALEPIVSVERNRAGEPVVFLGCGAPLESSLPLFGLMRIGADTKEAWDELDTKLVAHMGRPAARINLRDSIGRAFMNRTIYYADPDVVFLRARRTSLTLSEKRLIVAVGMMFGSQLMTSDSYLRFGERREIELTQWALSLADRLAGRTWGAVMIGHDLWRCFSRDGELSGLINLRRGRARITTGNAAEWGLRGEAILPPEGRTSGGIVIAPHAIALWRRS